MGQFSLKVMLTLTLTIVAMSQAKSMRLARNVKGGGVQYRPTYPIGPEVPVLDINALYDGALDYKDDYKYTDESYLHSPNFISSYEDDDDEEMDYEDNYESYEDDDEVQDPIFVPLGEGEIHVDESYRYDVGDEADDKSKDPDWTPDPSVDYDDYEDYPEEEVVSYDVEEEEEEEPESQPDDYYDDLWSSDDDPDFVPDEEIIEEETDDDDLWSSDDDPDFVPDDTMDYDTEYDDDDDDVKKLEDILQQLAIQTALAKCKEETGADYVDDFFKTLKDNLSADKKTLQIILQATKGSGVPGLQYPAIEIPAGGAEGLVKGKRQVKSLGNLQQQQSGQIQQSGHVQYDVVGGGDDQSEVGQIHQISHEQKEPVIRPIDQNDISSGVEPLYPHGGREIGTGVQPIDEEASEDTVLDWFSRGWGHVVNAADTVGDHVENTFDGIGDKISGAVDVIQDVAADAVDKVQDAAESAGESIVDAYHSLKDKLPQLRERIRHIFSKFGTMVQRGADYCVQHITQAADQVREAQILDKLQQKLSEGNEQVTAFFTILGEKFSSWAQSNGQLDVDEGLIVVDVHRPQEGPLGEHTDGGDNPHREELLPNLFQDQEIVDQLNQLVASGVITQDEVDLLSQQHLQQQNLHQQEASPVIQVQRPKRRKLRSHSRSHGAH